MGSGNCKWYCKEKGKKGDVRGKKGDVRKQVNNLTWWMFTNRCLSMPRLARLDAPGVLHHVMDRGIERRNIFKDDQDRDDLLARLASLLPETRIFCYVWSFMSNHAHFLFRTSDGSLSTLMRRLLTGYVVTFNRRHKRYGPLFQN